jgi:hypothetical protein
MVHQEPNEFENGHVVTIAELNGLLYGRNALSQIRAHSDEVLAQPFPFVAQVDQLFAQAFHFFSKIFFAVS